MQITAVVSGTLKQGDDVPCRDSPRAHKLTKGNFQDQNWNSSQYQTNTIRNKETPCRWKDKSCRPPLGFTKNSRSPTGRLSVYIYGILFLLWTNSIPHFGGMLQSQCIYIYIPLYCIIQHCILQHLSNLHTSVNTTNEEKRWQKVSSVVLNTI